MSNIVNYQDVLNRVLKIWVFCYGAITLQVVAGYFTSHILLPYIGFALIIGIVHLGRNNIRHSAINCSLMTHYTVYTLAISGVIMLVANLLNTNLITNRYSEFSHQNYPFHASFIIYPIATIMYGFSMLRRGRPQYCKVCRTTSEFSITEALRRNVLHHESKVQIRMAFGLSLLLTIVTYTYYFLYYRSGASDRKYSPDVFFIYIFPAIAYAISVAYFLTRHFSVEFEIKLNMAHSEESRSSHIRYMIIWRDKLLLKDIIGDGLSSIWDTPADVRIEPTEHIATWQAQKTFAKLYGSDDFELKRLFATNTGGQNHLHCAVFLPDNSDNINDLGGEWFALRELDIMLMSGVIARPMAVEIHRIFTITMAWKTYDREGNRLYPIKNYRPTFRLRDFKDWDVDYEDNHWLNVSENNQDKPFYKIRKFWRRYITGIDKKWQKGDS